jgi:hypothetical protein
MYRPTNPFRIYTVVLFLITLQTGDILDDGFEFFFPVLPDN